MGAISKVVRFFGGGGAAAPQAEVPHEPAQEVSNDSLKLPQVEMPRLEDIENALGKLQLGESLFVDASGTFHSNKAPFLTKVVQPMVSFSLRDDGTYSVFAGVPTLNPTFCGADINRRRMDRAVEYATLLRSGDWIGLGPDCLIKIPNGKPTAIRTGTDLLALRLALAVPGDTIELGRQLSPDLPPTVSRIHVTVEILEKTDLASGECALKIVVHPGIPATQGIFVKTGGMAPEAVHGRKTVPAGSRVLLGELGDVVLPHPEGSVGEVAKTISSLLVRGSPEIARKTMLTFAEEASDGAANHRVNNLEVQFLESHIIEGLELIKAGRHQEALRFFYSPEALRLVGYERMQGRHHLLRVISQEAINRLVNTIAMDCWFKPFERAVYLGSGSLAKDVAPETEAQRDLLEHWHRGVALLHAEEYTHVLQHLKRSNVSRFGALLSPGDYEADVAVFFTEQGIDCSGTFANARYEERPLAIARLHGLQTPAHEESFRQALHELPLGEKLYLGRDAHRDAPNERVFSIFRDGVEGESQSISDARSTAREALAAIEATIERSNDGSLALSRYGASGNGQIHAPDTAGYFRAVEDSVRLEPGTSFYLGGAFRFVLT